MLLYVIGLWLVHLWTRTFDFAEAHPVFMTWHEPYQFVSNSAWGIWANFTQKNLFHYQLSLPTWEVAFALGIWHGHWVVWWCASDHQCTSSNELWFSLLQMREFLLLYLLWDDVNSCLLLCWPLFTKAYPQFFKVISIRFEDGWVSLNEWKLLPSGSVLSSCSIRFMPWHLGLECLETVLCSALDFLLQAGEMWPSLQQHGILDPWTSDQ